jgi:histidine ammonia-lyase
MQSATDNPLVIGGRLISAGNFHGQAMSFAFDIASIALTTMAGISERRIAQLISGQSPRLSPFLANEPGLESGWMIPQVVAASLVSECKVLSHPASVDSIPTSAGKEDFVSMGMGAALKFDKIVSNAARVVAIEILAASHAVKAHRPLKPGQGLRRILEILANVVPLKEGDQVLSSKIEAAAGLILENRLV